MSPDQINQPRRNDMQQMQAQVVETMKNALPSGRKVMMGFVALVFVAFAFVSGGLIETKQPDDILVIQSLRTGDLTWYTGTESWVWQFWGDATAYKKRSIYRFDAQETNATKESGKCADGIDVRFNDGGHGTVCGSIQFEMPMDVVNLTKIHTKFKGQAAVQSALIETITGKAVYLSGPLMSSRESYAEKRNNLLFYIEDQIQRGVYKTVQIEKHVKDSITGAEKTATVVELVLDKDGKPQRQEEAVLDQFGIKAFNFAIKRLPYDGTVEAQIKEQQKITMEVQTSMADAKKAEQRAITVAEQGKANAAEAKWKQETIKAQQVTQAEQEKAVAITGAEKNRDTAKLERDAAEFYKQQQILKGEGDAAYRQKVMQANGALEQKLATYEAVMGKFAAEFGKQKWVPEVQMGTTGSGASGVNSAQTMMDVLSTKALRDLSLDMKMNATRSGAASEEAAPATAKPSRR
ncbi:MAG: hypothetical protein A3C93_05805 [Candidatus Lloydbacteria bacterium RIFCSPHIGHO2_02_FULL_54_17]|uniref:Band 7 domain-containing protein n=1 Tax=Candidatus Lloydbacteria bacterium RIFCSPHIGHO2_02_FULL_54_17 TaxID=1798664 RepID=A0A1G2DE53_9BACT|nr:MAG: hypothetical protein A2762_02755 [Candidatus Lloydbacteria bacterium RIFCSPHIGHO2_01_FULL_54_11]OGZ11927.1 MAG: hypothetical protein A3C93_05805 [Candidatus Lloydbacteria bacterium RIFCSPHIGHO2_02_FULL_54_17]OGZ14182.1 MAG: hypothetical protein A2948_02495 [Candidatus Lloydbacteria bacterium RIFCSPLOWO2_01_FULL_54_18]OGZ15072.1 MAG: hypothetical protein A3H76_06625 [Candidatus Lloydbacteria bacterium RIFCSPLOWO2_02_FULL_54_12]